ncbi:MAG: hypothetical protein WDZ30_03580 [Cellvibrionaceae bacterium]
MINVSANILAAGLLLLSVPVLVACQESELTNPRVDVASATATDNHDLAELPSAIRGKPSAPISVEYVIEGTPVAGQTVELELTFTNSHDGSSIYVSYRSADADALSFVTTPAEKMPIIMHKENGRGKGKHRLRLVPRKEGRHYLNVLMELETEMGQLVKSTSIPIDVASLGAQLQNKPDRQTPQRDVQVDSEGEAIISMPAREE